MTDYDAVLFDSDGVLVEPPSATAQAAATRAAFRAVGVEEPAQRHVDAVCEGLTVDGLVALCDTYGLDPERFWAARERLDEDAQIEAFEAGERTTYDDVAAVAALETPCGVVSNNHQTTIEFVLEHFGLESAFETRYGRPMTIESLTRKKPEPYYVERALADLGAESALYVGDSAHDVVAAERAGIDTAFLRRDHCRDVVLETAATHELASLHDLCSIVG